jgi:glutaconate CoA-transferase subunit A
MIGNLDDLVSRIEDGHSIALAPDYSGCAMSVVRELIAAGRRDLRLIGVPQMGFQADMLIGAGCVSEVETAAVTLGEFGLAPCFTRAVKAAGLALRDATCPAIHAGLQAAEKGIPFMPLRGILGSDLLAVRPDWKVAPNPFASNDDIVLLPAIRPDVALFHAPRADRDGNVWVGVRRELVLAAHAARQTLVTVEEVVDGSLLDDPLTAAGTLPGLYVSAVAPVREGAWPVGLAGCYEPDRQHLARYAELAASEEGFARYLTEYLRAERAA